MSAPLPRLLGITPGEGGWGRLAALIPKAVAEGMDALQVRDHSLPAEELAKRAQDIQAEFPNLPLILNGPPALAAQLGLAGVHHPDYAPTPDWLAQRHASPQLLFTIAAHGREGLERAESLRADAAVLSPVLRPNSKPAANHSILGWERFSELAAAAGLPVYALGGLEVSHRRTAEGHHAHGIAICGGLFGGD